MLHSEEYVMLYTQKLYIRGSSSVHSYNTISSHGEYVKEAEVTLILKSNLKY